MYNRRSIIIQDKLEKFVISKKVHTCHQLPLSNSKQRKKLVKNLSEDLQRIL